MDFSIQYIKNFLVICEIGNLIAAAKELNSNQPNLGRQMTTLEKEVGLQLFVRHSRGMTLTKQGEEFRRLCENVFGQFSQGTSAIKDKDAEPEGTLKIATGTGAAEIIVKSLPSFSKRFPKLSFQFFPTVNVFEFQIGSTDVSLSPVLFDDKDGGLVQHHIFDMPLRIYASPAYLNSHPPIKTHEDLKYHKLIAYEGKGTSILNLQITNKDKAELYTEPFIKVPNGATMRNVLLSGLGLGTYSYDAELEENNLLVDIFPDLPDQKIPYYYAYPKRLEGSPKIKLFHEFLEEMLSFRQRPQKL